MFGISLLAVGDIRFERYGSGKLDLHEKNNAYKSLASNKPKWAQNDGFSIWSILC